MAKKPNPYDDILLTSRRDEEITCRANDFLDAAEERARAGNQTIDETLRTKLDALAKAKGIKVPNDDTAVSQYFQDVGANHYVAKNEYFFASELEKNETIRRVSELLTKKSRYGINEGEEQELKVHIQALKNTSGKFAEDIDSHVNYHLSTVKYYDELARKNFVSSFIAEREELGVDINFRDDKNQIKQSLKEAFIRAGWRQDTVTTEMTSELIGEPAVLYRSKTNPAATGADMNDEAKRVMGVIIRKSRKEKIGDAEKIQFEQDIKSLSGKSGLEENSVRAFAQRVEKEYQDIESRRFIRPAVDNKTLDTSRVDELLKIKARGTLTEEQAAELGERIIAVARATNASQRLVWEDAHQYVDFIKEQDKKNIDMPTIFMQRVNQLNESGGETEGPQHIVVPKVQNSADLLWKKDEHPKKAPPGTPEQWQFLIDLHEAEHVRGGSSDRGADEPVIDFLREMNRPDMEKYWLQWRHVTSIQGGLEEGFQHDSATFYRVYIRTHQQPDMESIGFNKIELIEKIDAKMKGRSESKIGDIMGAVKDVLKDDDREKDPAKKLHPIARDQAEAFLEDAKDIGFKANSHYMPQRLIEPVMPAAPENPASKSQKSSI